MTTSFFQFGSPYFLFLLLLLPLVWWWQGKKKGVSIRYSSLKLFSPITGKDSIRFHFPRFFFMVGLALLIIALSRPQAGFKSTEITAEGIDIMLTLDTSGSMKALDFEIEGQRTNRMEVIKKVVDDFIAHRVSDRIGLVIFGDTAFTQCPLTLDYDILRSFLKFVRIGMAGESTAIGNALATSVKRLKDKPTKSKIIILLTDGSSNAGEVAPITAAQIAKDYGIKVYTIGVGSNLEVPFPQETPFGTRIIRARLDMDEASLKEIANITGGRYFKATDTSELQKIYATIDQLEKTEVNMKQFKEVNELYFWFVGAALLLMMSGLLLENTLLMRLPL
ncbi:MAG TPA: hypothetical protein DDW49_08275 [Deltaproteobacteria bacterium]|nr:MAG: hypothetical protein A2048_07890 [Deltaproteobacteria bacterium GWA2_45_12]HBF13360.1 hypothetical protein [Deltaproteobacteria bacterium]